jgi:hypothetical protein
VVVIASRRGRQSAQGKTPGTDYRITAKSRMAGNVAVWLQIRHTSADNQID